MIETNYCNQNIHFICEILSLAEPDLHSVWFSPPHEKVMVTDAEVKDQLVHSKLCRIKSEVVRYIIYFKVHFEVHHWLP